MLFWKKKDRVPHNLSELPVEVQNYFKAFQSKEARTILEESYVVFDLETTGLDTQKDKILSFAFLKVEDRAIQINQRFEGYLKLDETLRAADIHHVTKGDVAEGIEEEEFILKVLSFIGNSVLVGHHVSFDIGCIDAVTLKLFGFKLKNRKVDTAKLGARLENPLMSGYAGKKAFKNLDALCHEYDIKPEARHSASGDTYSTALLFIKLLHKAVARKIKRW